MRGRLLIPLYYFTVIGYLLLNDLTAFPVGPITMTSGDIFFILLSVVLFWNLIYNDFQIPLWKRGINIALLFYLLIPLSTTFIGFFILDSSIGVFSSPIRMIQLSLLFPITAILIHEKIIGINAIFHILVLVSATHFVIAVDRMFGQGDTILFIEAERILTSNSFTTAESRSAGFFGEVVWYGLLNGLTLIYGIIGVYLREVDKKYALSLLIISIFGIVISISRTGAIMSIPAIVLVVFMKMKNSDSNIALYSIPLSIFVFVVIIGITDSFNRFFELRFLISGDFSKISSLNDRIISWRDTIEIYSHEGLFGTLIPIGDSGYSITIDNYYLTALVQRGVLGFFSVIFLYSILCVLTLHEYFQSKQDATPLLGFSVTVGIALASLMFSLRGFIPVIVLFWITIGILYGKFGTQKVIFSSTKSYRADRS